MADAIVDTIIKEFKNVSLSSLLLYFGFVCVLIHLLFYLYARVKNKTISLGNEIMVILLVCYVGFIVSVTLLNRTPSEFLHKFQWKHLGIDELPEQNATNIMNIALYVPFGLLVAPVLRRNSKIMTIIFNTCIVFLLSISLETAKYVTNRGYFEVDNIEANILGALIGIVLICLVSGKNIKALQVSEDDENE